MGRIIHPQARTTPAPRLEHAPRTRAEINASTEPVQVLARLCPIAVATARKWHQRGSILRAAWLGCRAS